MKATGWPRLQSLVVAYGQRAMVRRSLRSAISSSDTCTLNGVMLISSAPVAWETKAPSAGTTAAAAAAFNKLLRSRSVIVGSSIAPDHHGPASGETLRQP